MHHWRLSTGTEVDFVVGDTELTVEAKASARATSDHLNGLRQLAADHPRLERRIVVCREPRPRITDDGIEILPCADFARRLWAGDLL